MISAHLAALLASLAILVMTLPLWPISWLVKRRYPNRADSGEARRLGRRNSPDWIGLRDVSSVST
jgi:hypothetical protein